LRHAKQSKQGITKEFGTSTDAMSLDGLLDSVSSGSFSNPGSPRMNRVAGKVVVARLSPLNL
jgi:hypothetical protein